MNEDKTPITIEFDNPAIKLDRDFQCEKCGEKHKITREKALNVGSSVVTSSVAYSGFASIVADYLKTPSKFKDFTEYRGPFLIALQNMNALGGNFALGLNTSIELPCGYLVSVRFAYAGEQVTEPKAIDVLLKLGVNTENAYRLLSYAYTGEVNVKIGKQKAEEINAILNAYTTEKEALTKFQGQLKDLVPSSITGLDQRLFATVDLGVKEILKELEGAVQGIVDDLDRVLARLARHPTGDLPERSWVAQGVT